MAMAKTLAIIGGGPSGLATAKVALEEGLAPTVFEKGPEIGGLWCPDSSGKVWSSLSTNLSKFTCAFSDFAWKEDSPDFPMAASVRDYLMEYAKKNNLFQYVELNSQVTSLEKQDDGRWLICWEPKTELEGRMQSQIFDFAIVATGVFSKPHYPALPGIETSKAQVMHASEYREPRDFQGKRVLVVGASFSGADIAAEITECASSVKISARRPLWYLPRYINSKPADLVFYSRVAAKRAEGSSEEERNAKRHAFFGSLGELPSSLVCPDPIRGDLPYVAITDKFLDAVRSGNLAVCNSGVVGFEKEKVLFEDGSREGFDVVLFATGYRLNLPFLSEQMLTTLEFDQEDWLQPIILHECVWHPAFPTLAFVGIYRGPYFAVIELQARWACGVFSGRLAQLTQEECQIGLQEERDIRNKQPRPQFPHGDYVSMAESLARHVKVYPDSILEDESHPLQRTLYDGPLLPFHYRLVGFGSAPEIAEAAIKQCQARYPLSAA